MSHVCSRGSSSSSSKTRTSLEPVETKGPPHKPPAVSEGPSRRAIPPAAHGSSNLQIWRMGLMSWGSESRTQAWAPPDERYKSSRTRLWTSLRTPVPPAKGPQLQDHHLSISLPSRSAPSSSSTHQQHQETAAQRSLLAATQCRLTFSQLMLIS